MTTTVIRVSQARLPLDAGEFTIVAYLDSNGVEHVAIVCSHDSEKSALVRVHSECLTGDVLGSLRCDCGPQLQEALRRIAAHGFGAVVYVRGHEGRGIGLANKITAYSLQDQGLDTVDANIAQGYEADLRSFATPAAILHELGFNDITMLTNNPAKVAAVAQHGIRIQHVEPLIVGHTAHNAAYLHTKRTRLGHTFGASTAS